MTQIRMTEGRDRGHVKDFPFVDAERMLATGQALPVDMGQPDALAYRELGSITIPTSDEPDPMDRIIPKVDTTVTPEPGPVKGTAPAPPAQSFSGNKDSRRSQRSQR